MASGKRGRPHSPFFADPESERLRVDQCIREGRNPYPPYKHEPCVFEQECKNSAIPGVGLKLMLLLNDCDPDGRPCLLPVAEKRWEEAKANRQEAARSGGEARPSINLAAEIIAAEAGYISAKKGEGWNRSRIINGIKVRRTSKGKQCASRTEMYDQIRISGLWV